MSYEFQLEQASKIFELCGSPDESNWPGVSRLRWYQEFKPPQHMRRRVREVFKQYGLVISIVFNSSNQSDLNRLLTIPHLFLHSTSIVCILLSSFDRHALDLVERMLTLDPTQVVLSAYCTNHIT